jgi:hypothetical protein
LMDIMEIQFYINQLRKSLDVKFTDEEKEKFIKEAKPILKQNQHYTEARLHELAESFQSRLRPTSKHTIL